MHTTDVHLNLFSSSVGSCIDGCKSSYKEDICIKSDKGKTMTVQSKCHYQCYEEYQGYRYAHHGKCKDSSKPSECMFEISFFSVNEKTIHQNLQNICLKSVLLHLVKKQSP